MKTHITLTVQTLDNKFYSIDIVQDEYNISKFEHILINNYNTQKLAESLVKTANVIIEHSLMSALAGRNQKNNYIWLYGVWYVSKDSSSQMNPIVG